MSVDDVLELRELTALADELADLALRPGMRTVVLRPGRLTVYRDALAHFVESRDEAEWLRDEDREPLALVRGLLLPLEELAADTLRAALTGEPVHRTSRTAPPVAGCTARSGGRLRGITHAAGGVLAEHGTACRPPPRSRSSPPPPRCSCWCRGRRSSSSSPARSSTAAAAASSPCSGWSPGALLHVAAATAGVSALVAASPAALLAVKFAGAAYLLLMGVRALRRPAS